VGNWCGAVIRFLTPNVVNPGTTGNVHGTRLLKQHFSARDGLPRAAFGPLALIHWNKGLNALGIDFGLELIRGRNGCNGKEERTAPRPPGDQAPPPRLASDAL